VPPFAFRLWIVLLTSILGGCVSFHSTPVHPDDTEAQVIAAKGQPTHRYPLASGHLLEYAHGPWGQETYMARFDRNGRLVSYEQVLTQEKFAAIKINEATKQDVLHTIGATTAHSYLALPQMEVWSYAYKESGVWDSVMNVYFDRNGIVRKLENMPDVRLSPLRGGAIGGAAGMPGR
jgi:hypothetical protein